MIYAVHQREFEHPSANVHGLTHDVNTLAVAAGQFDRCVSIKMFEHMRNYQVLP